MKGAIKCNVKNVKQVSVGNVTKILQLKVMDILTNALYMEHPKLNIKKS